MRVRFNWETLLAYRELKSRQFKRPLSMSEALALWLTDNLSVQKSGRKSAKDSGLLYELHIYH